MATPNAPIQAGYIIRLLYIALVLLICVHVFGTVGYMWLTDHKYSWFDCFYMTFITVATIGFGEIIDMSSNQAARMFTVAIGILGAGNLSLLFSVVTVAEAQDRRLVIDVKPRDVRRTTVAGDTMTVAQAA